MNCEQIYYQTYHHPPESIEFCPYRISPLGAYIDHQFGKINGLAINRGIHIAYSTKQNGVVELQSMNFPKRLSSGPSAILWPRFIFSLSQCYKSLYPR